MHFKVFCQQVSQIEKLARSDLHDTSFSGIGEYPGPTTNGLFRDGTTQIVEVAGMEDPKRGKEEPCPPEITSALLVPPPEPHEDGAPTTEGLHRDEFPRVQ